jgi:hypothetical protein
MTMMMRFSASFIHAKTNIDGLQFDVPDVGIDRNQEGSPTHLHAVTRKEKQANASLLDLVPEFPNGPWHVLLVDALAEDHLELEAAEGRRQCPASLTGLWRAELA